MFKKKVEKLEVKMRRDFGWFPVKISRKLDIHELFQMYNWGRKNVGSYVWVDAIEYSIRLSSSHISKTTDWIWYFPTETQAEAFALCFNGVRGTEKD